MSAIKYVVLCLGIFAATLKVADALSEEDQAKIREKVLPALTECGKEYNADKEALKEVKETGEAGNINNCFFACVFRKTGLMNDEGKFSKDAALEKAKALLSSENVKEAEEVIEDCIKVNDEDVNDGEKGCERAVLMFKCLTSHKHKFTGL